MSKASQFYLCGLFILLFDPVMAIAGFELKDIFTTGESLIGYIVCFGIAAILEEIEKQAAE